MGSRSRGISIIVVIGAGRLAGRRAGESKSVVSICNLRKIKGLFFGRVFSMFVGGSDLAWTYGTRFIKCMIDIN